MWIEHYIAGRVWQIWRFQIREGKEMCLMKMVDSGCLQYSVDFSDSQECSRVEVTKRGVKQKGCCGETDWEVLHTWPRESVYAHTRRHRSWMWERESEMAKAQETVSFGCSERRTVVGRLDLSRYAALSHCVRNMLTSTVAEARLWFSVVVYLPLSRVGWKLRVEKTVYRKCDIGVTYEVVPCRIFNSELKVPWYSRPSYGLLRLFGYDGSCVHFDQVQRDAMNPNIIHQRGRRVAGDGSYSMTCHIILTAEQIKMKIPQWNGTDWVSGFPV